MKERPILFSAPMVRAILAGAKTQTRRVAKWKPREPRLNLAFSGLSLGFYCEPSPSSGWVLRSRGAGACWNDRTYPLHCPYGKPGDRLWVRETFGILTGNGLRTVYRADGQPMTSGGTVPVADMKWHPSIFMRRHQSRITLEVTGVRVERLQAITEDDAKAEGAAHRIAPGGDLAGAFSHVDTPIGYRNHFRDLWDAINGKPRPMLDDDDEPVLDDNQRPIMVAPQSWASNPWVWVVEFRRVEADAKGRAA